MTEHDDVIKSLLRRARA